MNESLNQLTTALDRLKPVWGPYLKKTQGLDLDAPDLAAELNRTLNIDRNVPGFEDFAPQGTKGVAAGDPAASLLYHALASPNVTPDGATGQDFPTWDDLDAVENYIWAAVLPLQTSDLEGKVVAVFAYQYRPKPATTHQLYADLVYSRMGFARVGNVAPRYIGSDRGYTAFTDVAGEVAVLPARYGAFLAEWRAGTDDQVSMIGETVEGDADRKFLYPLRKLFSGDESVVGAHLSVAFAEWHLNTKLARVVGGEGTPDGKPMVLPPGLDATRSPFVRQSPDPELAIMENVGAASVKVMPPAATLIRVAQQQNTVTNRPEIARFIVSPAVSPTITDVVMAILQNSDLRSLVDRTIDAMRATGQFNSLDSGIGAQLDAKGATAMLTGNPNAKASDLNIQQLEQVIATANSLIQSGKATHEQLDLPIQMFTLLLTIARLKDATTAPTVSEQDKATLFGFVMVEIKKTVLNRHYSSLSMTGDLVKVLSEGLQLLLRQPARVGRGAPEFANIRHKVIDPAYPSDVADLPKHILDLNTLPLANPGDADPFNQMLTDGGYEAALFEDGVSDGCVSVDISGLPTDLAVYPACSVVGAPSLFPRSSDLDLEAWWRINGQNQFAEGDPQPLAEGRFATNPAVLRPGTTVAAFDFSDKTLTAVVGRPSGLPDHPPLPNHLRKKFVTSFMPDAASNEFYPGWDVTIDQDNNGDFYYTTHGLGSPYPEDVKFCSAANGFWPAAAPDSARVFHRLDTPTAIPLMDSELGYHPDAPMVLAGKAVSNMGWDGGYGPFFQSINGKNGVNYASLDRTDYVSNALAGTFALSLFEKLGSDILIERLDIQRLAIKALPPEGDEVRDTPLWLITAYEVADWAAAGDPDLKGHGYFLQFVTSNPDIPPVQLTSELPTQTNKFTRLWQEVDTVYTCRVTVDGVRWWIGLDDLPPENTTLYRPTPQYA